MHDEEVLVVNIEDCLPLPQRGIIPYSVSKWQSIIGNTFFINREEAEKDTSKKQIIPYILVFDENLDILLYRRNKKQNESRLHEKYSVGFGGHINPEDGAGGAKTTVYNAAIREVNEELGLDGILEFRFLPVAFLNDDTTDVGKVHLGCVFFLKLTNEEKVAIKAEDKADGVRFVRPSEMDGAGLEFESWSSIILEEFEGMIENAASLDRACTFGFNTRPD